MDVNSPSEDRRWPAAEPSSDPRRVRESNSEAASPQCERVRNLTAKQAGFLNMPQVKDTVTYAQSTTRLALTRRSEAAEWQVLNRKILISIG
jgi:hypothetical protein